MELLILLLLACAADGLMELGIFQFVITSIFAIGISCFLIWHRGYRNGK